MSCETCDITPVYKETEKWQKTWVGLDVITHYNGCEKTVTRCSQIRFDIGQETTSLGWIVANDHLGQNAIEKIIRN